MSRQHRKGSVPATSATGTTSTTSTTGQIACVSFGYGTMMKPCCETCTLVNSEDECVVPAGFTGGGKRAYPGLTCEEALARFRTEQTVLSALENNPTLVALVGLVPGLLDTLVAAAGSITILAPSESAFGQVPAAVVDFLKNPDNVSVLEQVLKYHVVAPNTSNLLKEAYPTVIPINKVLIPPSLTDAVASIAQSTTTTTTTQAKQLNVPSWLARPRSNNNWS